MTDFSNEHFNIAKHLQDHYNHIESKTLHVIPPHITRRYASGLTTTGSIYAAILYHKHISQYRHFYLVSKAISNQIALNALNANTELLLHQNKELLFLLNKLNTDFYTIKNSQDQLFLEITQIKQTTNQHTHTHSQERMNQENNLFNIPLYMRASMSM